MKITFKKLHHIQICIPNGEEIQARDFYCSVLGLQEIPKPQALRNRGGFWLQCADIEIHIGVENFSQVSKRHPAFIIEDIAKTKEYLQKMALPIKEEQPIPGIVRFSIFDPWQNRIELMAYQ